MTIGLSDERAATLRLWAKEAGLPPEELLRRRVEQFRDRPDVEFQTLRQENGHDPHRIAASSASPSEE